MCGSNDRDSIKVTVQPGTKDRPQNKGEFNHLTPFQSAAFLSEPINSQLISPSGCSLYQAFSLNVIREEEFFQLTIEGTGNTPYGSI